MASPKKEKSFLKKFLNVFFTLLAMFAVGLASYKGVFWYCTTFGTDKITIGLTGKKEKQDKIYTCILVEDTTKKHRVEGIMVRILQPDTNNVDFLVIPPNTKLPINGAVYKELKETGKTLHDVTTLQAISNTDENQKEKYDLIMKAVGEIVDIESLSEYEVYDKKYISTGIKMLEQSGKTIQLNVPMTVMVEGADGQTLVVDQGVQALDGDKANSILFFDHYQHGVMDQSKLMVQFFSQLYEKAGNMQTDEKTEFYQTLYGDVDSNQKDGTKEKIVKYLSSTTPNSFYFHFLIGYDTKESYELNTEHQEKNKELITSIVENKKSYETKQNLEDFEVESVNLSTDLSIMIYNGTRVSGLASEWKSKLENNGYKNIIGVGNDNATIKEETTIYVKAEGVGYDLFSYFPRAKLVIDPSLDGMDIKIVIGRLDSERE